MRRVFMSAPSPGRSLCRKTILLVLVLIISFCGCAGDRAYSGINLSNADEIAGTIRSAMQRRAYRVKITFRAETMDRTQVKRIADDLIGRAFYESGDPRGGDYLRYQYGGYEIRHTAEKELFKYKYTARITPVYFSTAEQEAEVDEEVGRVLGKFALTDDATDYEKVRCVRDFVADTVRYDTVHKHQSGSGHVQSTAYGALIYHTALCQGYAVLTYRLLKELGVDARIVTGTAAVEDRSERHAWNIVKIGDVYYNLDVTMDDVKGTYDYFLKTDEVFSSDHTRDREYCSDEFYEMYPMAKENYVSGSIE